MRTPPVARNFSCRYSCRDLDCCLKAVSAARPGPVFFTKVVALEHPLYMLDIDRHAPSRQPPGYLLRRHMHPAGQEDLHQHFDRHGRSQRSEGLCGLFPLGMSAGPLLVGAGRLGADVEPVFFIEQLASHPPSTHVIKQLIAHSNPQQILHFPMRPAGFGFLDELHYGRLQSACLTESNAAVVPHPELIKLRDLAQGVIPRRVRVACKIAQQSQPSKHTHA